MAKDKKKKDDNPLVSARHESSVLFSLKDLGTAMETEDSPGGGGSSAGSAEHEASGFINLGAIAKSSEYVRGGDAEQTAQPYGGVPSMVPMVSRKSNKGLIIAISVGAVLLLSVLGVLVFLLLNQGGKTTTVVQTAPPVNTVVAANTPKAPPTADKPPVVPAEPAAKDDEPDDEADAKDDDEAKGGDEANAAAEVVEAKGKDKKGKDPKGKDKKAKDKKAKDKKAAKAKAADAVAAKARPADKPKAKSGGSVDSILDGIAGKNTKPKAKTAPAAGGPKLQKSDIQKVVRRYMGRVRSCGGPGKSGTVKVRFTIQASGRVSGAAVQGSKKGKPEGSCVASVVRSMKFPQSGGTMNITYPFKLP